jgi:hypothetical protein
MNCRSFCFIKKSTRHRYKMANIQPAHEKLNSYDDVKMGTERSFGLVFALFCLLVAMTQWWTDNGKFLQWFVASSIFALAGMFMPRLLRPFNLVWFKFGILLHRIISPVIMGLMFFLVFTPIGVFMRLLGKNPLQLEFDTKADTYWISRTPPGPPPESFPNQF